MPTDSNGFRYEGNITLLSGSAKYHSDPSNSSTTVAYTGDFANLAVKYAVFKSGGWTVDLESGEAGIWTLNATYPIDLVNNEPGTGGNGTEVPEISWDLTDKVENKSALDVDNATVNLIPSYAAKLINDAITAKKEEVLLNGLALYLKNHTINAATYQACVFVYHHMAAGIKTIPLLQPVLTKNAVSSKSWIIDWSEEHKGRIFSTDTLINAESVDPRLWNVLPRDVYTPSGNDDLFIPKAYGWLKGGVRSQVSNHGKNVVNQSWEYGLWPILYFGTPL